MSGFLPNKSQAMTILWTLAALAVVYRVATVKNLIVGS